MKVGIFEFAWVGGGSCNFLRHLTSSLDTREDIEYEVLGLNEKGNMPKDWLDPMNNCGTIPSRVLALKDKEKLISELKEFDLIFLNRNGYFQYDKKKDRRYLDALIESNVPIVSYLHSEIKREKKYYPFFDNLLSADNFKCIWTNSLKDLESFNAYTENKYKDKADFLPLPMEIGDNFLKYENKIKTMGTACRVSYEKMIPYMLKELTNGKFLENNKFIMNGFSRVFWGVDYRDKLKERYPEVFANPNFVDNGAYTQDQLWDRLKEVDLLVNLTNTSYGHFEYSIMEAMAMGRICVTATESSDLFVDGNPIEGIGVKYIDYKKKKGELERVFNEVSELSVDELNDLVLKSREYLKKYHSYEAIGNKFMELVNNYVK